MKAGRMAVRATWYEGSKRLKGHNTGGPLESPSRGTHGPGKRDCRVPHPPKGSGCVSSSIYLRFPALSLAGF